jgi:hypothetical protein
MEVAPLKTADYECCLSVVGLYIGMEANKRRICIINLWKVPKWGWSGLRSHLHPEILRQHRISRARFPQGYKIRFAVAASTEALMFHKLVEPIMFPLIFLGLFWFSERNKNSDRKPDRQKMRFWTGVCALMACGEYAAAWHGEIGLAWQNYPNLTSFSTLAVVAAIFGSTGPLPEFKKRL